jgi:hypothetical protein
MKIHPLNLTLYIVSFSCEQAQLNKVTQETETEVDKFSANYQHSLEPTGSSYFRGQAQFLIDF